MSSLTPHSSRSPASRAIAPLVRAGGVGGGGVARAMDYEPRQCACAPRRTPRLSSTLPAPCFHGHRDHAAVHGDVPRARHGRLDAAYFLRTPTPQDAPASDRPHLSTARCSPRLRPAELPPATRPNPAASTPHLRRSRAPRRPLRTGDSAQASAVACAPRRLPRAYALRVASNARACRPHARAHAVNSSGALRRRRDLHAELRTDVSDSTVSNLISLQKHTDDFTNGLKTRSSAGRDPQSQSSS
ncbi:hypothetical protein B0H10DRAFT_153195 [Mycena sp. CBHHK59/15]|nr:hypothetical protein B0H10DRAFT_153195 [Mycena sp. CBHHK59/15]